MKTNRRRGLAATLAALLFLLDGAASAQPARSIVGVAGGSSSSGLGTLVTLKGGTRVITALHVVKSSNPTVYFGTTARPAEVEVVLPVRDVAVLTVANIPREFSPVALGDGVLPREGGPCAVAAYLGGVHIERVKLRSPKRSNEDMDAACEDDWIHLVQRRVAFTVRDPFQIAVVENAVQTGDSGAGVFDEENRLLGVVVLKESSGQGPFFGVVVPVNEELISVGQAPNSPLQAAEIDKTVLAALSVALHAQTRWRFVQARRSCAVWSDLLGGLEKLDRDSIAERLDNSLGPRLNNSGTASVKLSSEEDVHALATTVANDLSCGGWTAQAQKLIEVMIQVKALERRVGTFQTLWSAMHRGLVRPPDNEHVVALGWELKDSPFGPPIYINPVERLLDQNGIPPDMLQTKPRDIPARWRDLLGALNRCAPSCGSGLAGSAWPSAKAVDGDADDQRIIGVLKDAMSVLSPNLPFTMLVMQPRRQAAFWKKLVDLDLLDVKETYLYAGRMRRDVFEERAAYLLQATPAVAGLKPEVDAVAGEVVWSSSKVRALSASVTSVEAAYATLPPPLLGASSPGDVLKAFVDDTSKLGASFGHREGSTALAETLHGVQSALEAFEGDLGAAIVELIEEPDCLGARPADSAAAASACASPPP